MVWPTLGSRMGEEQNRTVVFMTETNNDSGVVTL